MNQKPFTTKDYFLSQESFNLIPNAQNDILKTSPLPDYLENYYTADDYISHHDNSKMLFDKIYQIVRKIAISKKIKLIKASTTNAKSILDIGAGTGDFLVKAKQKGFNVYGIEPNKTARIHASKKGIYLKSEYPKNQTFDVITMWHVLEHIKDLDTEIERLQKLLKSQGTLIIAVPNYKSYDARYYKSFWAAYDVPRHIWHFSKKGLIRLFKSYKWKFIKSYPMLFDAFYVSILSETYKKSRLALIKGAVVGSISNLKSFLSKEYSSNIFIFKN